MHEEISRTLSATSSTLLLQSSIHLHLNLIHLLLDFGNLLDKSFRFRLKGFFLLISNIALIARSELLLWFSQYVRSTRFCRGEPTSF